MPRGSVVTRPYEDSNVGSNLASLAGAAWLAGRLDRELIVDWRGLSQLGDKSLNYFTEFFEAAPETLGVPTRYAPVDDDYGRESSGGEWLSPGEARALAEGRRATDAEHVVLQPYHGLDRIHPGPEPERFRVLRSFYRALQPAEPIAAEVEAWAAKHLDGAFVIGVNVRTGNGRYFGRGEHFRGRVDVSVFDDRERFLRTLERACRRCAARLPRPLRRDAVVFYASDSAEMSELLTSLPNAVTRRRVFPPPGTGDLYTFEGDDYTDRDSIRDTLVDMFLLARCDALVYNSSLFNQYARVLTGWFSGNQVHFESLFLRNRARYALAAVRRRLG